MKVGGVTVGVAGCQVSQCSPLVRQELSPVSGDITTLKHSGELTSKPEAGRINGLCRRWRLEAVGLLGGEMMVIWMGKV
jgi:hypothetical protein